MLHQIKIRNNNDVEDQNLVTMLITHFQIQCMSSVPIL